MASLRKRFSQWALGDGDNRAKRPVSMDVNRGSIDSGYHSMTQKRWSMANSHSTDGDFPKFPPGSLRKALSTTFSYVADTVRQGATSFHQESSEKSDSLSNSETTIGTPKKQGRHESLFSSVRSRRSPFSPKSRKAVSDFSDSPETSVSSSRVSNELPPVLDVAIPHSSMNNQMPHQTGNATSGPSMKQIWPSPRRVAVGLDDPYIDRDDLSIQVRNFVASALSASSSPRHNAPSSDDKGYVAEGESSAEPSDVEAFSSPGAPDVSVGKSEATIGWISHNEQGLLQVGVDERTHSPTRAVIPPRGSSTTGPQLLGRPRLNQTSRSPSEMYEADAEVSEPSPDVTPSMGSRALWEKDRAERHQRYLAVIGNNVQPRDGLLTQHQPPDSPTRSTGDCQPVSMTEPEAIGPQIASSPSHEGELGYAAEAAERLSGMDLPDPPGTRCDGQNLQFPMFIIPSAWSSDNTLVPELAQASQAQDDQQSLSDSDTDISANSTSQQTPFLQLEDAYEAGLRAAGLSAYPIERASSAAPCESSRDGNLVSDSFPRPSTPTKHFRSVSNLSEITDDSCAVTTSSPSCDAPPPFPSLHVRSEPARLVSADLKALDDTEKADIALIGPANTGLTNPSLQAADSKVANEDTASVTQANCGGQGAPVGLVENEAPQKHEDNKSGTPQKAFNAARLPSFGSPSPSGASPKGSRSLRRKKRKPRKKAHSAESSGNAGKKEGSSRNVHSPQFSVRHFESAKGESSPYSGHELDPVSFAAQCDKQSATSSPLSSDKKAVSFAKDVDIIERHSGTKYDLPIWVDTDDEYSQASILRQLEDEVDDEEDVIGRFVRLVESIDHRDDSDKENAHVDEGTKPEKPRWRVPSKIIDS